MLQFIISYFFKNLTVPAAEPFRQSSVEDMLGYLIFLILKYLF